MRRSKLLLQPYRLEMKRGFTWVELLVIVVVIGVAVLLAMPVFLHVREASQRASCLSNLRSLSEALEVYALSNDSRLPFSMPANASKWRPDKEASDSDLEYWENAIHADESDKACPIIDAATAYAYNGYLHAYAIDEVAKKNNTISLWEGFGRQPRNHALPRLNCGSITEPCSVDDTEIATIAEAPTIKVWTHGRGANFLFLDGHAAWKRLGDKSGVPTDPLIDPFHEYTASGHVDKFWLNEDGRAPLFMP